MFRSLCWIIFFDSLVEIRDFHFQNPISGLPEEFEGLLAVNLIGVDSRMRRLTVVDRAFDWSLDLLDLGRRMYNKMRQFGRGKEKYLQGKTRRMVETK